MIINMEITFFLTSFGTSENIFIRQKSNQVLYGTKYFIILHYSKSATLIYATSVMVTSSLMTLVHL